MASVPFFESCFTPLAERDRLTSRCSGPRPRAAPSLLSMLAGPCPGPESWVVRRPPFSTSLVRRYGVNRADHVGILLARSRGSCQA